MEQYHIRIIRRGGQGQTADDYHATVTRGSDGQKLVFISGWKWLLKLKTRRWLLKREFKSYDKYQAKLAKKETFTR